MKKQKSGKSALTPAEVVDASIIAFNTHDVDAFARWFSDDVQVFEHPDRPKLKGKTALIDDFKGAFFRTPQIRTTVIQRMVVGARVVDLERVQRAPDAMPFDEIVLNEINNGLIEKLYLVLGDDSRKIG
jgi:hypothetical protein